MRGHLHTADQVVPEDGKELIRAYSKLCKERGPCQLKARREATVKVNELRAEELVMQMWREGLSLARLARTLGTQWSEGRDGMWRVIEGSECWAPKLMRDHLDQAGRQAPEQGGALIDAYSELCQERNLTK